MRHVMRMPHSQPPLMWAELLENASGARRRTKIYLYRLVKSMPGKRSTREKSPKMIGISRNRGSRRGEDERGRLAVPAIEFRHVDFSYDDNEVLNDLSFQVARGEVKIILSGSG